MASTIQPFLPLGDTQNVAMDGTAKTITLARKVPDIDGCVNLVVVGTATAFVRVDGVTPTVNNSKALTAGSDQNLKMPVGGLTVKLIGAAGSTVYVTPGQGG